jgi:hypothetical protein
MRKHAIAGDQPKQRASGAFVPEVSCFTASDSAPGRGTLRAGVTPGRGRGSGQE